MLATMVVTPAGAAEPPPALHVDERGRSLIDPQGRAVFLLADTAWSMSLRLRREQIDSYLRHRRQQGFNAVAFVLFAPGRTELVDKQANAYGDAPFESAGGKPDPTRPLITQGAEPGDDAQYDFWDHTDYAIDACRAMGMYAIVLPTWGSGVVGGYGAEADDGLVFNEKNAAAYGKWLGARYRGRGNVIWMLGGDRSAAEKGKDFTAVFKALAAGITEGAGPRPAGVPGAALVLISYHPKKKAPQSSQWFHNDPWLSFNSIQAWPEDQVAAIEHDWNLRPPKPTWLFEGRYEGYWKNKYKPEQWGEWQVRQQAWQTVLAGAFGHTYGHERVFGFGADGADWTKSLDAPGAQSMTHLAAFIGRVSSDHFLSRVPDQSLINGDAGKAERLASDRITAMRSGDGSLAIFYVANGREFSVRMSKLVAGTVSACWYNPRTGRWFADGQESDEQVAFEPKIPSGGEAPVRRFNPPGDSGDGQDWLLVLTTSGRM